MTCSIVPSRWWRGRIPSATWLFAILALLAAPIAIGAQYEQDAGRAAEGVADWSDDIPAHISVVDGRATLARDGASYPAEENVPLLAGDRLSTERGRIEVLFGDGSVFDLDEDSSIDMLSESLVRLHAGRVRILIPRTTGDPLNYRVDTVAGSAILRVAGEYRVSLDPRQSPQVDLAVFRGTAELINDEGRTVVRAGSHAYATDRVPPSVAYAFNSASWDPLDRWAEDRRRARYGTDSAQYLPADLRHYGGAFDEYGTWLHQEPYGRVWFPRVHSGWRPYSVGRWSVVGSFGWFWIGADRWSWPTHHYGRWQFGGGSWFWIPDRRWAPAWVSWAYTRDYVSWCPLGFDGRPAIGFGGHFDPWLAWTVVPARVFIQPVYVRPIIVAQVLVPVRSIPAVVVNQFTVRSGAPAWSVAGRAVARPLRSPTQNRTGIVSSGGAGTGGSGSSAQPTKSFDGSTAGSGGSRAVPDRTGSSRSPAIVTGNDKSTVTRGSRVAPPSGNDAVESPKAGAVQRSEPGRGSRTEPPAPSNSSRSRTETNDSGKAQPPPSRSGDSTPPPRSVPAPAPSTKSAPPPPSSTPPPATSSGSRKGGGGGGTVDRRQVSAPTPTPRSSAASPRYAAPEPTARYSPPQPSPRYWAPQSSPRYSAPESSRNGSVSSPRYAAPSPSPRYSTPKSSERYSAPTPSPRYSSPESSPRYSAPTSSPRYSAPPSSPRYDAPASSPRYSSPPSASSGGSARSRVGSPAPSSAPPSRPAPSSAGSAPSRSAPSSRSAPQSAPAQTGKRGGGSKR
jgi:hypothetical protein